MNTMQKEAAVDATSFCMVKNEAARGRPYEAAKDQANRRGDLWSPDRTRQREAAKGRPYEAAKDRANRRGDLWSPDRARQREAARGRPYSSCRRM